MSEHTAWSQLGRAAASGDLVLHRGTAQRCADRCDDLISRLKDMRLESQGLTKIDGFGDLLHSGVVLAAKFERKASGGEYSLDRALTEHIEVVQQMRDVFLAIENRYAAAEEANTAALSGSGSAME